MATLLLGVGVGILLVVPIVFLAARRTERRVLRLEKRARAAERLAELGMLTGGLAHEIKNPLSSVGLNIQLVQEDLRGLAGAPETAEKVGRVQRRVDALARETQRLREILDDFLRFAGRMRLDLAVTDINQIIDELVDFYGPAAQASKVRIRTQLSAQPGTLRADASLLKQAMLNLMINATQAMAEARGAGKPNGGGEEIIIRTESGRAANQDEIFIHITDTGPGIAPETLGKIFQPYFSTKRSGSGLGLPTTRRIIEEHGGSITVHSEVGKGSDFILALPVAGPPPKKE